MLDHGQAAREVTTPRRTWVFDLDGTLVDSFGHYFTALEEIFAARGMVFREELRFAALTAPLPELFGAHLGKAAIPTAFAELQARSNDDARRIRPFAGAPELLAGLRARGHRVAVWTNRDLESAALILRHSGLGLYVEYCVSGTCVEKRKPHPEGLSRILAYFSSPLASVTMVGDHEHDIQAAKAAGAQAVRASWHGYWPIARCQAGSDREFRSIQELKKWIGD